MLHELSDTAAVYAGQYSRNDFSFSPIFLLSLFLYWGLLLKKLYIKKPDTQNILLGTFPEAKHDENSLFRHVIDLFAHLQYSKRQYYTPQVKWQLLLRGLSKHELYNLSQNRIIKYNDVY